MKTFFTLIFTCALAIQGFSQTHLNLGAAYMGDKITHPGALIEFELERFFSDDFSVPIRADLGFFSTPDYNSISIDVHTGGRQYLPSGLFFEQSVGLGLMGNVYQVESIFYMDKYDNAVRYAPGINWGFMPSVTLGVGYNLSHKKDTQNLIWIRPKVYWNFGVRGLNMPYAALQLGFTHNLK